MNPYIIIGALLAVIGAFFAGQHNGKRVERAEWMARENKELVAANSKITELNNAARAREKAHAATVNNISTVLQGKANAAQSETERLRAAARDGTLRLLDPSGGQNSCGSSTGGTSASAGERDAEKAGQLPGKTVDFLLSITGEADEIARQLAACQAILVNDRAPR